MPPNPSTGPPSAVLRIADRLEREGKRQEAAAIRAVNAQYANMSIADLVALTAQFTDKAAPPERVAGLDRLMAAFRQSAAELAAAPSAMNNLLQSAVQTGITASQDMMAVAGGALEMFRVPPDAEIEYTRHAADRLTRYWGKEQARFAAEVESVLLEGLERGQSSQQMAARLRGRADVSRSRARLIVANELGNASANAQQQSQTDAGITHYTWVTAHDERVRPEHKARDGKIFAWNDPPSDGHPGQAVRCRCVSVPVIPTTAPQDVPDSSLGVDKYGPLSQLETPESHRSMVARIQQEERERREAFEYRRAEAKEAREKLADLRGYTLTRAQRSLPKLIKQRDALAEQKSAMWDEAMTLPHDQRGALLARRGKIAIKHRQVSMEATRTKLILEGNEEYLEEEMRAAQYKLLQIKGSRTKVKYSIGRKMGDAQAASFGDAEEKTIRELVGRFARYFDRDIDQQVKVEMISGRPFYDAATDVVYLNPRQPQGGGIGIHEMGHWVEQHYPDVARQSQEFLRRRAEGKTLVKLKEIYPKSNYQMGEVVFQGAFDWSAGGADMAHHGLYASKLYGTTQKMWATEVLTMGLQLMFENPRVLAQVDPEFFEFIYTVSRGTEWLFTPTTSLP